MMKNIILFGKPGAGKGTQAALLRDAFQLVHISTGDLFRYNIGNNTSLGALAKSYMDQGDLVPDEVTIKMLEEMPKFVISSILMIAFLLSLLFRRVSGVILPLLTVVLSLFSTIGLFSMTGTKLTIISQILPSFLLAVGVGYSVHLLVIFYRHLRDQGNKREAIGYALGHSGLAILITSLTTAGGLLSFSPVKVAPVSRMISFVWCLNSILLDLKKNPEFTTD